MATRSLTPVASASLGDRDAATAAAAAAATTGVPAGTADKYSPQYLQSPLPRTQLTINCFCGSLQVGEVTFMHRHELAGVVGLFSLVSRNSELEVRLSSMRKFI